MLAVYCSFRRYSGGAHTWRRVSNQDQLYLSSPAPLVRVNSSFMTPLIANRLIRGSAESHIFSLCRWHAPGLYIVNARTLNTCGHLFQVHPGLPTFRSRGYYTHTSRPQRVNFSTPIFSVKSISTTAVLNPLHSNAAAMRDITESRFVPLYR